MMPTMAIRATSRGERQTRERGADPVGTVSCGVRGVGSGGTVTRQVWTTGRQHRSANEAHVHSDASPGCPATADHQPPETRQDDRT